MKKLNKVILVMVIIMGVMIASTQVQATIVLPGNSNTTAANTTTGTGSTANTTPANTTTGTGSTVNTTAANTTTGNKVVGNNTTNTLPKTGIEDSPAGIIMIICVVSAVYAYKKIRDYNV